MKQCIESYDKHCLRVTLYSPFNNNEQEVISKDPLHSCCSFCASNCDCGHGCVKDYLFESIGYGNKESLSRIPFRTVSKDMESLVRTLLIKFRNTCFDTTIFNSVEVVSGLCDGTIEEIIQHLPYINTLQYIEDHLTIINDRVAEEVLVIIQECFEDFEFERKFKTKLVFDAEEKFVYSSDSEVTISDDTDDDLL